MVPSKYRQHSTWPPCCERLWRPPHRWPFLSELRALDTFANQHLSTDKTKSHWEILFQAHGMNSMQFQQQVVLYFLSGNLEGTSAKQIQTFLSWAVIRLTFASPWTWWKEHFMYLHILKGYPWPTQLLSWWAMCLPTRDTAFSQCPVTWERLQVPALCCPWKLGSPSFHVGYDKYYVNIHR